MTKSSAVRRKSAFACACECCAQQKGCSSCEEHKSRISELEEELRDANDRLIRVLADRENLKWRVIRAAKGE